MGMTWKTLMLVAAVPLVSSVAIIGAAAQSAPAPAGQPAPAPPPQAAHTARLILLGTAAGPIPRAGRSQPANLLVVDGKPYLIDAGAGVSRQIVKAGFSPRQVRTIFITHHHIDHNAGLGALMSFIWVGDNEAREVHPPVVDIIGPPATSQLVDAALDFLSISERIFSSEIPMSSTKGLFVAKDVSADGVVYQDDRVRVTAVENTHFHAPPGSASYGKDKSYSYRFDTPAGSIVFTGDTGPSPAVEKLAKGADVLVSEVANADLELAEISDHAKLPPKAPEAFRYHLYQEHLAPEAVGKMAQAAGVKTVVLTHFSPGADGQLDTTPYTAGVKAFFKGAVIPGKDLLEYDLFGADARHTG